MPHIKKIPQKPLLVEITREADSERYHGFPVGLICGVLGKSQYEDSIRVFGTPPDREVGFYQSIREGYYRYL